VSARRSAVTPRRVASRRVAAAAVTRAMTRVSPFPSRAASRPRAAARDDADGAAAPPPRRRVVRRPAGASRRTRVSDEDKRARLEALRARDLALRAKPRVDALLDACARDETRRAQELKKELIRALTIEAVPLDAHLALVSMYCRARLPALAERAFADALRAGSVPDASVWELVECFDAAGEPWRSKANDVLAYLDRRHR